jgi:iron complex outermembrane recepter protein
LNKQITAEQRLLALTTVSKAVAITLAGATTAYAQTAPAPAPVPAPTAEAEKRAKEEAEKAEQAKRLSTIVVRGIRRGIEEAISVKRNAEGVVEAISAEDIGKMPDPSVADSVTRLPGVTAQRDKGTGRSRGVSVRGMSPDFAGALLNGREQASSGDSRGVEFDQFPGELLAGVTIHKTPHAGLVGQGLSGTIDLQTVRPLNFPNRVIAANFRNQRTGIDSGGGTGKGDRVSLSYIDQFFNRSVGVALGFARFDEKGAVGQRFNSWGDSTIKLNGQDVKVPAGFGADSEQTLQKRDGLMGVLQIKPTSNIDLSADVFYSKGDFNTEKKGIEGAVCGSAGGYDPGYTDGQTLVNATVSNGVVTSGTCRTYNGVVRNHNEASTDELRSFGLNGRFKLADWTIIGDLSSSKNTRSGERYETTAGQAGNTPDAQRGSISWTGFNGSNFTDVRYTTSLNYADPNVARLTDVNGWGGGAPGREQAGYVANPQVVDDLRAARLTVRNDLNWGYLASAEVGFNSTDREKSATTREGYLVIPGGQFATLVAPGASSTTAGASGIPITTWNPRGSLGSVYSLRNNVYGDVINRNWTVNEDVTTFYVKGNLDGEIAGIGFTGNVGLQFQNTDQSSSAFQNDANRCTVGGVNSIANCPPVRAGKKFNDVLPSVNLAFDLGSDQVLRVGFGKVLARPKLSDMRANIGYGINNGAAGGARFEGGGGNPFLEPFRANAFDVSYEKYFGKKGYVSVAFFNKSLQTYIYNQGSAFDFTSFLAPGAARPTTGPNAGSAVGILTQPINGKGGSVRGTEFALNVPFSLISPVVDGFGVQLSRSDTTSSINVPRAGLNVADATTASIPLPGLSKRVSSIRAYYESGGFQFGVAQRSRSDFVGEITDFKDDRTLTYIKGEEVYDAQISYELQSGALKGLSFLFQANNLTNAEFKRYRDTPSNIIERVKYGKTYLMGVNYRF